MRRNNKMDDFIDMMDMKQGWIQDKFEDIFEMVCNNEIFEDYDNPDIQMGMIRIGIEETEKFLKRLESLLNFYNENI
tara:strand:+ start:7610 stop:7840 length:231 start_codon:yes stop_codon:yes gene_type:complete